MLRNAMAVLVLYTPERQSLGVVEGAGRVGGAITVSAPVSRVPRLRLKVLTPYVLEASAGVLLAMGYRPAEPAAATAQR